MSVRYHVRLPDPAQLGAAGPFGFRSRGAGGIATELQDALRGDALFTRWRDAQDDPDAVDPSLGASDPSAIVSGEQDDLQITLTATTSLLGAVVKHRLRLLAGNAWELRDVTSA